MALRNRLAMFFLHVGLRLGKPEPGTPTPAVPVFVFGGQAMKHQKQVQYQPSPFESGAAQVVAQHGVTVLLVQGQACACVQRLGSC